MAEQTTAENRQKGAEPQDIGQLQQIRREKLAQLQQEGRIRLRLQNMM